MAKYSMRGEVEGVRLVGDEHGYLFLEMKKRPGQYAESAICGRKNGPMKGRYYLCLAIDSFLLVGN